SNSIARLLMGCIQVLAISRLSLARPICSLNPELSNESRVLRLTGLTDIWARVQEVRVALLSRRFILPCKAKKIPRPVSKILVERIFITVGGNVFRIETPDTDYCHAL